jgi:hypothetical protein
LRFGARLDTDSSFSTDVIFLSARILSPGASCNIRQYIGFILIVGTSTTGSF